MLRKYEKLTNKMFLAFANSVKRLATEAGAPADGKNLSKGEAGWKP